MTENLTPSPTPVHAVGLTEAQLVLAALETGDWVICRVPDCSSMTDEANRRHAYTVQRQAAPFCAEDDTRIWTGPTAFAALKAAADHLQVAMPGVDPVIEQVSARRLDIMRAVKTFGYRREEKDHEGSEAAFTQIKMLFDAYAIGIYEAALEAVNAKVAIPAEYGGVPLPGCGLEGAQAKLEWAANTLFAIKDKLMRGEPIERCWDTQAITMASAIYFVAKQIAAANAQEGNDTQRLNDMEMMRMSVGPEYDGPWEAVAYGDDDTPRATGEGGTIRQAIDAAVASYKGLGAQS